MSDDQKDTQASGTDPKNEKHDEQEVADATDPSKTPTDGNKDATDQKKTSSNENKDATDPKQTPTDHKDEHIPQNIASVLQHIRDPKLIKDFSAALQSFSLGRHTSNGHSASETVQASNGEKEHAKMQYNLPPDVKDKKKKLLIGHGISFLIHVIMTYTLFLEWYNAIDPKITVVGAIILMVFVLCLLLLAFGGFVWMLHGKYKNEKAETEFFISLPLFNIACATIYQFVVQLLASQLSIKVPNLASSIAASISVATHMILHTFALFWKSPLKK